MKITTRLVLNMNSGEVLSHDWYEYQGPLFQCKGATAAQTNLQQSQAAFYNVLQQDYSTQFAYSQSILKSLEATWSPILQKGPSQYGYSPQEDSALRSQATEGTATAYTQAAQALHNQEAARSGGDTYLPSGTEAQLDSTLLTNAAKEQSDLQLGITTEGYNRGYNTFMAAANVLGSAAGIANPTGYAGAASTAGADAGTTASQIQQANAASSPWGAIGGILGGAASAFTGGFGTALGGGVGKSLFGGSGPSTGGT